MIATVAPVIVAASAVLLGLLGLVAVARRRRRRSRPETAGADAPALVVAPAAEPALVALAGEIADVYARVRAASVVRDEAGSEGIRLQRGFRDSASTGVTAAASLASSIGAAGDAVEVAIATLSELNAAVSSLAGGVSDVNSAVSEMEVSLGHAAERSREGLERAREGERKARESAQAVAQLIGATRAIAGEVALVDEKMRALDAGSERVAEIVATIASLSYQTNLLALNAAIEAARSGETGRGFSIVAEQVRALAEYSAVSARDIGARVEEVRAKTRSVATSTRSSIERAEHGLHAADVSAEIVAAITAAVGEATVAIDGIAAAAAEHVRAAPAVLASVDSMAQLLGQAAAALEEQARTGEHLSQVVHAIEGYGRALHEAIAAERNAEEIWLGTSAVMIRVREELDGTTNRADQAVDALADARSTPALQGALGAFDQQYAVIEGLQRRRDAAGAEARKPFRVVVEQLAAVNESSTKLANDAAVASAGVEEMVASVASVSANSVALAQNVTVVSDAVTTFGGSIRTVAQGAGDAAERARSADEKTREGAAAVDELIRATREIVGDVATVSDRMRELEVTSTEIGTIIEAIERIAEQTNLLALNAAIEAARAGADGRAFAVVAAEVRNLAERSAAATRQIRELVAAIREDIAGVVAAASASGASATSALALADVAAASIGEVSAAVGGVNREIAHIARATGEQATAIGAISGSLGQMTAVMRDGSRSLHEQTASNDRLLTVIAQIRAEGTAILAHNTAQQALVASYIESVRGLTAAAEAHRVQRAELEALLQRVRGEGGARAPAIAAA
ncbi:MAG TPA: methyl-accepting chemotaxis protein [Candidatus Sulfotelmatobacter sp.]|nr:methyl-accepting chemotaxis protein [Candidatus Sulfotelmatobacter sp.]